MGDVAAVKMSGQDMYVYTIEAYGLWGADVAHWRLIHTMPLNTKKDDAVKALEGYRHRHRDSTERRHWRLVHVQTVTTRVVFSL